MVVVYKKSRFSLPNSSVPAPKRLPRLPVFPRLRLFASPLGLDLHQLLISLLLDFRRGAAQAHEELRARELLGQFHSGPDLGVLLPQLANLLDLSRCEVVLLLILRPHCSRKYARVAW